MKKKINQHKIFILIALTAAFFTFYFSSQSTCADGLVPCKDDCNLCYLLVGFANIFQWLGGSLLITATVFGIVTGGISYIISGVFPKVLSFAKQVLTGSLRGFAFALCGWLIVNAVMNIAGWTGSSWWRHECAYSNLASSSGTSNSNVVGGNQSGSNNSSSLGGAGIGKTKTGFGTSTNNNNGASGTKQCDSQSKKLESVQILCDEKDFKLEGDGTGFYIALDALSEDESKKTKKLKALAKYTCDGETTEEDVTAKAEWKASDETQVKVSKGVVAAVTKNMTSESPPYVEAKFQEKNSNQANVYINACPTTQTADAGTENKFSFSENSLTISKANAQTGDPLADAVCESCGQISTCHWVAGNKDKKPPFVIIMMRRNDSPVIDGVGVSPCKKEARAWPNDPAKNKMFGEVVKAVIVPQMECIPKYSINYTPIKDQFALYYSDLIGSQDLNCPNGEKFTSFGYIYYGKGDSETDLAFALNKTYAYYCHGSFSYGSVFAHEHIGHIIGKLDDEYEKTAEKSEYTKRKCFTNCTFKVVTDNTNESSDFRICRKWNDTWSDKNPGLMSISERDRYSTNACIKGCFYNYSGILYRSIDDGIMNNGESTDWGQVNKGLIIDHVNNWPVGGQFTIDMTECRNVGSGCGAAIVNNIEAMTGWTFTCLNLPPDLIEKGRWLEGLGDCSSTTSRAYTQAGCKNPGISTFEMFGKATPLSDGDTNLKAGDALVWNNGEEGHVGICLDDGCSRLMGACTKYGIYPNCDGVLNLMKQAAVYGADIKVIRVSDFCKNASCQNQ